MRSVFDPVTHSIYFHNMTRNILDVGMSRVEPGSCGALCTWSNVTTSHDTGLTDTNRTETHGPTTEPETGAALNHGRTHGGKKKGVCDKKTTQK